MYHTAYTARLSSDPQNPRARPPGFTHERRRRVYQTVVNDCVCLCSFDKGRGQPTWRHGIGRLHADVLQAKLGQQLPLKNTYPEGPRSQIHDEYLAQTTVIISYIEIHSPHCILVLRPSGMASLQARSIPAYACFQLPGKLRAKYIIQLRHTYLDQNFTVGQSSHQLGA